VIHHIEVAWVQNLVNTDQARSVKLEGDRLTLRGGFLVEASCVLRIQNLSGSG
jgi:hypothetical protein